ncbi:hypothetical protein S7711_08573 [Stachybotrys chartarum IBT 7711]|uniref:Uncharacterized protein n=1 Tax=Stachybotrys chartarum (strain CBS 109288 / IBT 7711) TaxID=1280523 RepID=A0A084AJG1_STACB|nr:hypothetical protein S7711_08573 [Stachybotrys chartarum IBT 7711]
MQLLANVPLVDMDGEKDDESIAIEHFNRYGDQLQPILTASKYQTLARSSRHIPMRRVIRTTGCTISSFMNFVFQEESI